MNAIVLMIPFFMIVLLLIAVYKVIVDTFEDKPVERSRKK